MIKIIAAEIDGRVIPLSNLDKIFWPSQGYCKNDLIEYYSMIAPYIMKYLKDRPLVFVRYPNGIDAKFFYQKNAPSNIPEWFNTYEWENSENKMTRFILVEEKAALVWLANQACIEIHPWLSSKDSINQPDYIIFDLDPSPDNTFSEVVDTALLVRKLLAEINLKTWVKTSGASGLHIYLPVINKYSYEEIRVFAGKVASIVTSAIPELTTIERKVDSRGRRIYLDFLQNVRGQTICSPYSVRAVNGATVSAPIQWEEIKDISPNSFNIKNILSRVEKIGDIFESVLEEKQDIAQAMKDLGIAAIKH
ncbi:MAG: non-homologous end-joining DNA ligase [Syntrophomonadaceae bacterium]|nr:non-homologous end-joining DNA ligase [Syntrophomonadaceae bacterium]